MQVTQALGRSVVRTLGYVETPGETLQIIMEASQGSVLHMVEDGKFGAECAVRPFTATTLLLVLVCTTLLVQNY